MRSWIKSQFRTFRRVHAWWRDQLTVMGKVIFVVMVCSLPALADSGAVLAIVFIASSVLLLGASTASFVFRPQLAVRATCPENWMQRECRTIQLKLTNRSRRVLLDVTFELLPTPGVWEIVDSESTVAVVQPGETITVPARVRALRRGLFQLPSLRATTLFPLQLVRRSERYELTRKALILPFYRELSSLRLARTSASFSRGSNLALQTVGLTGEYVGSREYQPGIPVRKWDYASWARLGQPVVREFSEPRHPSAAVIVDTIFPTADGEAGPLVPELEAMLSLAASITGALIAERNRIDVLVVGNQVLAGRERFSGEDHLAILEHLALARPSSGDGFAELITRIEDLPVTWDLAVIVSHRWTGEQERLFEAATRRGMRGERVVVGTGEHTDGSAHENGLFYVSCSQVEAGTINL